MNLKELNQTKALLTGRDKWIIKHLPFTATTNQTPYDLITIAIRNAGFDFFAANSKAREILNKANI